MTVNSINFGGHLHFGQRTNKVVHFRKLEDEKNNKNTKKAWRPSFGAKAATQEVGCWWWWWDDDELPGMQATPRPSCLSAALHSDVGLYGGAREEMYTSGTVFFQSALPPPQTNLPSSPQKDERVTWRWFKVAFAEGTGADCPGEGIICRPADCAAWLLLSFHNFGYKIIQLKEVTENKAMQGRVWGWGGCTVHDGREGLHDVAAFSCSMAVEGEKVWGEIPTKND